MRFLAEVGVQKSLPDGQDILTLVSYILTVFRHLPIGPIIWTPAVLFITGLISWFLQWPPEVFALILLVILGTLIHIFDSQSTAASRRLRQVEFHLAKWRHGPGPYLSAGLYRHRKRLRQLTRLRVDRRISVCSSLALRACVVVLLAQLALDSARCYHQSIHLTQVQLPSGGPSTSIVTLQP